jgi:hypothetical protein
MILIGLQPVVFIACGVYAGMVYAGIVGARTVVRSRVD